MSTGDSRETSNDLLALSIVYTLYELPMLVVLRVSDASYPFQRPLKRIKLDKYAHLNVSIFL